jgi:hypothetical protein
MNKPNPSLHTNRRPAFRTRRVVERWIRCQRPFPAAVGEPYIRSTHERPTNAKVR